MKLQNKKFEISLLLIATLIVGLTVYIYSENAGPKGIVSAEANQGLALTHPTFPADVTAATSFLNQEAGMAIWLNATAYGPFSSSQMTSVKSAMVYVENSTPTYVIGSLSDNGGIPNSDDYPHCFVYQSGWIVVYYLKVNTLNPGTTGWIGKIIDWGQYTNKKLNGNYLSEAMNYMATTILGIPSAFVTANEQYFHFQYPSATKLMIAIKGIEAYTATFNINIPSNATIYEYSWSCNGVGGGYTFKIDTTTISAISSSSGAGRHYGGPEITSTILTQDVWHTISISSDGYSGDYAYVCLLLLYS
jgi:hypothetical protein